MTDDRESSLQTRFWKEMITVLNGILNELKEIEDVLDNMNDNVYSLSD